MAVHLVMRITFLLLLTYELAEAAPPPIAKPNCTSSCGNVTKIPYPFGIGHGCYMNRTFEIVCNGSDSSRKAFLPSIDMEVLEINMSDPYNNDLESFSNHPGQMVRVNMPIISSSNCNGSRSGGGVNMTGSPFYFSTTWNTFISVGCDNMAIMTGIDPMVTGCKSDCNNKSMRTDDQKCSGFKCCQTAVPDGIQVLNVDFKSIKEDKASGECKHAWIAEYNWLDSNKTDPSDYVQYLEYVPVVLRWTATNEARGPNSYAEETSYGGDYYYCNYGYQGNPYLPTGCEGKLQIRTALIFV
uniref:Wall-associated receptor kinase galacturonan-binding domain-containing protein n=1 Tax=Fagus sylvatica TaxID=28930 RepID=A0A2N9FMC7_FAGSY